MLGGLNPKKMQAMMKQLGMSQEDIEASKVTIEKTDKSKIVFDNPKITKITMQGQDTYQIVGEPKEESAEVTVSEEDINTVIEKTGCTKEKAKETLEKTGDLAEAILELSK